MSTPEQLMGEIRQLLQQGRQADAAAACREALAQAPDNADLRMLMGLCEEAAGRPDSARAWMEKALDKQASHPAAGFHLARLLLIEGRDEEARAALDRCIAHDPNHAAARTLLARVDQRAGQAEAAIEGLRTALVADPDHAPAHAGLAVMLLRRAELDEAHKHASAAVRLRPDDALSQVTMAQVFQAQGHFDFAEQCLRNALARQPEQPQLRAALEQLERVRGASATGQPDVPEQQLARMRAHYRQGQLLAAAELADLLQFRLAVSDPLMLELAEVLMDAGQVEGAADVLARADAALPRHGLTRARLAAVRGDLRSAQQQLAELFGSEQGEIRHDARRLAADLHLRAQNLEQALQVLRPLAGESTVPPATLRMLAQLEHAGGETATAQELLGRLLEREDVHETERAAGHNLLGRILDEAGDYQAAARHLAQGGWRQPFMVDELAALSPVSLREAWQAMADWKHPATAVDDGRVAPLFISGWPGSGREALMSALLASGRIALLAPEELMRRREILRLPAAPDELAALSEADLRLGRKRYLLGAAQDQGPTLEPGQIEATALPAVARFFPGAVLLRLQAAEASLKLHWRLAGCREIERMVEVWRAEQALFDHLAGVLPLQFVDLQLDALLEADQATVQRLASMVGADDPAALAGALQAAFQRAGYRAAGHWRHYPELA